MTGWELDRGGGKEARGERSGGKALGGGPPRPIFNMCGKNNRVHPRVSNGPPPGYPMVHPLGIQWSTPWVSNGPPWVSNGPPPGIQWFTLGIQWSTPGYPMVHPGYPMVHPWVSNGPPMGIQWFTLGIQWANSMNRTSLNGFFLRFTLRKHLLRRPCTHGCLPIEREALSLRSFSRPFSVVLTLHCEFLIKRL